MVILENGRVLIRGFIKYQWFNKKDGFDLNLKNNLHKSLYKALELNRVDVLLVNGLQRILIDEKNIIDIKQIQGSGRGLAGVWQGSMVMDNVISNNTNNNGVPFQNQIEGFYSLETLKEKCLAEEGFVMAFYGQGIQQDGLLEKWLEAFNVFLKYKFGDNPLRRPSEYKQHFGNWLKFPLSKKIKPEDYSPVGEKIEVAQGEETMQERYERLKKQKHGS
jgi:hypothetical protein